MLVASLIGNPALAVVAAVAAPVAFVITFWLLAKDPGDRRGRQHGHPAYTGPPEDDDDDLV
jgi:hypothetical protein